MRDMRVRKSCLKWELVLQVWLGGHWQVPLMGTWAGQHLASEVVQYLHKAVF